MGLPGFSDRPWASGPDGETIEGGRHRQSEDLSHRFALTKYSEDLVMAEGVGFEPTEPVRVLLISSQVPLNTQPPFHLIISDLQLHFALTFPLYPAI